jgi:hypothetical protein
MTWLFSNRHRLQKIAVSMLLLVGLCVHTNIIGNQYALEKTIILEGCLKRPNSCVNKPLVMRVQINHSSDGSIIAYPRTRGVYQLGLPILLSGELTGIQHGFVIDILGSYSFDNKFVVTKYQRNDWIRPVKYSISLLGLFLTIILLFRRYKFSSDQFLPLIHR